MRYIFIMFVLAGLCLEMPAQADSAFQKAVKDKSLKEGIINIYTAKGKTYFDIPKAIFKRDFIWYAELSGSPLVEGIVASETSPAITLGTLVARLELHEDQVYLRDYSSTLTLRRQRISDADDQRRLEQSLVEGNIPPILLAFPVLGRGENGSVLIDVTSVMANNHAFFDLTAAFPGLTTQDAKRSFIKKVESYPTNVRITSVLTFNVNPNSGPLEDIFGKLFGTSATIEVQHSIYLLPEKPMQPRLADPRLGYFKTGFKELVLEGGFLEKAYINRYRLEKKTPGANLSEPVKPIVYYIGPNVPARYRPIFKESVEMWNIAFKEAGFVNAIVAKDPPDDPSWSPNDLGHSVIRWIGRPVANARGPINVDPRSGEILSAHVMIWEDVVSIVEKWYYLQGSGADPRMNSLPLPGAIQDSLIKYVVAHEVGHTLGLRHNHRASQVYSAEQLRDPDFTDKYGPVASIMSYGRINYIAQPGDGVTRFIPKIGPYDLLAIKYGYKQIPGAHSPEAEVNTLNKWLEAQRTNEALLYGGEDKSARYDPMVLTENIGRDRITAYEYGMKNLQRAVDKLPAAIGQSPQDIPRLKTYYEAALAERFTWLSAAAKELKGVLEMRTLDPAEAQFEPVPDRRKQEVLRFLLAQLEQESALFTPAMKKIYAPYQLTPMIVNSQTGIVDLLMDLGIALSFGESSLYDDSFPYSAYLLEVQRSIFSELLQSKVEIRPLRREIQRQYFKHLKQMVSPSADKPMPLNARSAAVLAAQELKPILDRANSSAGHLETRAHLLDLQMQVDKLIES